MESETLGFNLNGADADALLYSLVRDPNLHEGGISQGLILDAAAGAAGAVNNASVAQGDNGSQDASRLVFLVIRVCH